MNLSDIHYSLKRIGRHVLHFWPIIIIIGLVVLASIFSYSGDWHTFKILLGIALFFLVMLLCMRPLNAVYGLIGTSGSIGIFFINLIILSLVFSGIYYWGFFKTAGICYDINQPDIEYGMFADSVKEKAENKGVWKKPFMDSTVVLPLEKTIEITYVYDRACSSIVDTLFQSKQETMYYQSIDFGTVYRNTLLTFFMQEPTDLFAVATTYNAQYQGNFNQFNKEKSEQLNWVLILQVLAGWFFFGVFISILYNKFRYES